MVAVVAEPNDKKKANTKIPEVAAWSDARLKHVLRKSKCIVKHKSKLVKKSRLGVY